MKDSAGAPGTLSGLCLRIMQCLFAAMTIACGTSTHNFFDYTAYCFLIATMGVQVVWTFGLALLDAYAIIRKKILLHTVLVALFVIGDGVIAMLSLAGASASGGITMLFFSDWGSCELGSDCDRFQFVVALAFFSWFTISVSFLIMLWLLAAS